MASETPPDETTKAQRPTIWTAVVVLVLMGGLVAILAITTHRYSEAEEATSILGVVIPAIVSFGAAAFGVAVAYNASGGKAEAEAGQADAQAKQQSAEDEKQKVQTLTRGTAVDAMGQLKAIESSLQRIVDPVTEASRTSAGRDLVLAPASGATPVKVHGDDIDAVKASIAAAQTNLENLLRGVAE